MNFTRVGKSYSLTKVLSENSSYRRNSSENQAIALASLTLKVLGGEGCFHLPPERFLDDDF